QDLCRPVFARRPERGPQAHSEAAEGAALAVVVALDDDAHLRVPACPHFVHGFTPALRSRPHFVATASRANPAAFATWELKASAASEGRPAPLSDLPTWRASSV